MADAEAHMIFEVDEEGVRPVSGSGQVGFAESDGLSPATWDRPCALALDRLMEVAAGFARALRWRRGRR